MQGLRKRIAGIRILSTLEKQGRIQECSKSCEGSREKKTACKVVSTVVKRSIEGGIAALKGIAAKDLIEELRFRGYKGKLVFTREVVV